MMRAFFCLMFASLLLPLSTSAQSPAEPIDFSRQIQPILAKRCYACHGPDKAEGGLRLNSKEAAFAKLESGTHAIAAKDVSKSELIKRVLSREEGVQMPPEGAPLSDSQIELLRRWIEQGAEWKEHWAFVAPQPQQPPVVKDAKWVANPIDSFILSKLEQQGFVPAPPADKTALLRRITFDLTGLPPTPAEVESFLADDSPTAYEKVVDRLLQSQHYGEKWARHWLDVVRYADTNSFERDGAKPNAWRYRDYVIRSFNNDKPYDQFVREQLAGDELPTVTSDSIIATGFYRLGLWDDEPADRLLALYEGFDDIITTTSQAFLGLTVNCARCHDHKIDPITQRDYYAMLSFFQGITPNGNPNPNVERAVFENDAARVEFELKQKAHQEQLNATQASVTAIEKEFRERVSKTDQQADVPDMDELEYRFYRDTWEKLPKFDDLKAETTAKLEQGFFDISPATREFSFGFVFTGTLKIPADGTYVFELDSDDGSRLTVDGKMVVEHDGIHGTGSPKVAKATLKQGRVPIRLDYFQGPTGAKGIVVKWYGPGFEQRYLSATTEDGEPIGNRRGKKRDFNQLIKQRGPSVLGQPKFEEYQAATKQLEDLKRKKVEADYALCVTEIGPNPPETFLLKRGNPQSPGDKVVPAFQSVIGGGVPIIPPPAPNAKTSGRRLALANWIASPDNRLTARVMVNRLWQHHFGRGIVRSPNNVGLLGDSPTHPELLDWLAAKFSADGWRMKPMHKLIVMSNTYRMGSRGAMADGGGGTETAPRNENATSSSLPSAGRAGEGGRSTNAPANSKNTPPQPSPSRGGSEGNTPHSALRTPHSLDPLNQLFWRHDMRRLSAEELRDSILATTGQLNAKMYGPGIFPEISDEVKAGQSVPGSGWHTSPKEEQSRRSVYVHVKRSLVLPILSDFDVADSDTTCAARFATTQPTQALGMLNGKFLNDQAAEFANRLRKEVGDKREGPAKVEAQVTLAYRLALGHEPDKALIERGLKLIDVLQQKHGQTADQALNQFCLMVLNLNEFVYLD